MHYSSDESINEDEAFNSEDEAMYGKFFKGLTSYHTRPNAYNFLGVKVDVPKGSDESDIVTVEVEEGNKLVLSNACLDVPDRNFKQLRLVFRCDDETPWMCLCNFLSDTCLSPTVSLNTFEVIGPCILEWKVISTGAKHSGSIDMFGKIIPTDAVSDNCVLANGNKHAAESTASVDLVHAKPGTIGQKTEANKTNKRKLSYDNTKDDETKREDKVVNPENPGVENKSSNKLTKKQRKQLAEVKAKQLEDTLTAARPKSETKSKKKKKDNSEEPSISRQTSLTRERRLPGGILVSDILIGTGTTVSSGRKISLHYTGSLTNGKVFDKNHSRTQPLQFRQGTGEVIRGLERGLEGMRVGGERLITVPASLGYGDKGMGIDIPPDSDLIFEVKVLKVG